MKPVLSLGPLLCCSLALACAGIDSAMLESVLSQSNLAPAAQLDDATIVNGLKEALNVGAGKAVSFTSVKDGFLGNPQIRIPMPDQLESVGSGLRKIGFGSQVDAFEVGMNRAAESASGEALDIFTEAIGKMSFSDARGILDGGENAATEYFQRTTDGELQTRFAPIVDGAMKKVGLVQVYDDLMARYTSIPLMQAPKFDLRQYVNDRARGGLFSVLADEEKKIRTDPAARVTDLLQTVFGGA